MPGPAEGCIDMDANTLHSMAAAAPLRLPATQQPTPSHHGAREAFSATLDPEQPSPRLRWRPQLRATPFDLAVSLGLTNATALAADAPAFAGCWGRGSQAWRVGAVFATRKDAKTKDAQGQLRPAPRRARTFPGGQLGRPRRPAPDSAHWTLHKRTGAS